MADNSYNLEIRLASKNGWHTPAEARAYYGRYSREGLTVHWWGDGTGASNHDNIVNFILNGAEQGTRSVNYVLSDNKITMLVNPDNVAWCSQAGNPTTVSVEFQPTLGDEGYKKAGWLIDQLEQRFGHGLTLYPHNHWFATQCPGTLNIDRMRAEANKWKSGAYDASPPPPAPVPTPVPTPTPPAEKITWTQWKEGVRKYVFNKDANLWNFNSDTWAMQAVKQFKKGEIFEVFGQATNKKLNATYYLTQYSFSKKITNGVNPADLDVYVPPVTVPPNPPPNPIPVPPTETPLPPVKPDFGEENNTLLKQILALLQGLVSKISNIFK